LERLTQQVEDTERAFAKTMADRDFDAFASFLAGETVFFSGKIPLRGKQRVAETWSAYFEGPDAPFSWEPELVAVLESGTLALSSGPVRNSAAARFEIAPASTWPLSIRSGGSRPTASGALSSTRAAGTARNPL
jgi:hypothetical protein